STATTARPGDRGVRRPRAAAVPALPGRTREGPGVRPRRRRGRFRLYGPRRRPRGRASRPRRAAHVRGDVHIAADGGLPPRPGRRLGLRPHGARRAVVRRAPAAVRGRRGGHHAARGRPAHPRRESHPHVAVRGHGHRGRAGAHGRVDDGHRGRRDGVVTTTAQAAVTPGDALPPLTVRVTRADLVRYAGASGDFNPIHWSERFAVGVGL